MKLTHLPSSTALALLLAWGRLASAEVTTHQRLVHETTTRVELELTSDTVLCSAADYSFPALKILIPELAALTLLDHQNFGAGAPCVAAGQCGLADGVDPEDILDPSDLSEEVDVVVKAIRVDEVDDVALTCLTSLIERVDVQVRGVPFFHERYADLGSRAYADCAPPPAEEPGSDYPGEDGAGDEDAGTGSNTPPDDGGDADESPEPSKSDQYGDSKREAGRGGCSTGGHSSSSGLLVLLVIAVMGAGMRRRRWH